MRKLNVRVLALLMLIAGLIGGLAFGVHQFQVTRNAAALLREAGLARERNDTLEAIEFLERYISLVPENNAGPLADLAFLQADLGRYGQAFRNLDRALRQVPERQDIRRRLVDVAVAIRRYADAKHNLDILLESSPEDVELLGLLARCQSGMGEYQEASDSLKQGIEIDPARLEYYARLAALLHDRLKDPAQALSVLNAMVEENVADHRAYVLRGEYRLAHADTALGKAAFDKPPGENAATERSQARPAQQQEKSLAAAVQDAGEALKIAPNDEGVILFAVRCYLAVDQRDQAAELARRGLILYPQNVSLFAALSNVELKAGNRDEAILWLQRGLAAVPKQPNLLWNLLNLLLDAGRVAEVDEPLQQLRSLRHPQPLLGYIAARIMVARAQWFEASKQLEGIRADLLKWPDLTKQVDLKLGQCYEALGRPDLQVIAFRRAMQADPRWVAPRLGVANTLLAMGKIDEALEEYGQIVALPGAPPSTLAQFARLLILKNLRRGSSERNWNEVLQLLDRLAQFDPDSPAVPILRSEVLLARGEIRQAEQLLLDARDRSPETIEFWLGLATLAERRGEPQRAGELLEEARNSFGDAVPVLLAQARHLASQQGSEAKASIRELAKVGETLSLDDRLTLYSGLASLALAISDFDEAERLCKLVADKQTSNLRAQLLLLDLAFRSGKSSAIEEVLERVHSIEHSGPLWHYGEAVRLSILAKQDQRPELYAKAKDHLIEARIARPGWSRVALLFAQIHDAQGDEGAAISDYIEAINLGERNSGTIGRAVALLSQQKRFKEADRIIRQLQDQQSPFSLEMSRLATDVFLQLNDNERALEMMTKTDLTSKNPKEHIWAGQRFSALGRNDEAEKCFRQAIELDETAAVAWVGLIQHLGRTDQTAQVEAALEQARQKIKPDEAPLALAQALDSIGRFDEAEIQYRSALDADPDNIPLVKRVVEFYLRNRRLQKAEPFLVQLLGKKAGVGDDDRFWCRRNLALVRGSSAQPAGIQEALLLLAENLALQPGSVADRRAKAMLLALLPDRASRVEAVEILEKLLVEDKSQASDVTAESRFALVQLYAALGDVSKTTTHLRSLMATSGDQPRYLAYYLRFLISRNEIDDAELWLPRLVAAAPQDSTTLELSAEIQFRQQRYEKLLSSIDKFISNAEGNAESQLMVRNAAAILETYGKRLASSKNTKKNASKPFEWGERFLKRADALYRQLAADRPQEAWALAAFLGRQGRHGEALDIVEKEWTNYRPEDIAYFPVSLFTSTAATEEHFSRAEQVLRAALDTNERPIVLVLSLADLQSWREIFDDAEQLYREVLHRQDGNAAALNNLAVLLAIRGRGGQEPVALIEKAIEMVGPDPNLLDSRATINLALGNPKSAAADLEQVLAIRPNALSFVHRAQVEQRLGHREAARESLAKANELGLRLEMIHPLERPGYRQLQNDLR